MSSIARPRPIAVALLASTVLLAVVGVHAAPPKSNSSAAKGIAYRWVDEQGVVHYGDHIPPEYATQDRVILNNEGVEVGHLDAQKTAEQQATDARERAAAMKQKQHDAFLITTYTSVKDIETLRDARLDQLKGQRTATEQYVEGLRVRLASLQSRALSYRPYSSREDAFRMPDDLAENLVRTVHEMRDQRSALAVMNESETALRTQFQADIERYRELHTIHSQ